MPNGERLDAFSMAWRVAHDFVPGQVVALGLGLPSQVPQALPPGLGIQFLSENGALGYEKPAHISADRVGGVDAVGEPILYPPGSTVISVVDHAAMIHGGHVDVAVVQAAQVSAAGDFAAWTSANTPGVNAPGTACDLAAGASRVIAMLRHTDANGNFNILPACSLPLDGVACIDQIMTDVAVMRVEPSGLVLTEIAMGWRVDDVLAVTGVPLIQDRDLREMTFHFSQQAHPSKVFADGPSAVADMFDGAAVMIDGFAGPGGMAHYLMVSLREQGARELTIISNTAGIARVINFGSPPGLRPIDHSILIDNNQVKKAIASYPVSPSASRPSSFELAYRRGEVELELVPQGTLAERLRAGGAGIAAFYTPTGVGTLIAEGKETRVINGKEFVLETGLKADYCLIRAHKADTLGNVVYKGTSRNFNPVMAPAAAVTIVEVDEIVQPGKLNPEEIVTPGVYVDRIVQRPSDFSPYE